MPDQTHTSSVSIYHKGLLDLIASKCNMTKSSINAVLDSFGEVLVEEVLEKGKRLRMKSLGTFQRRARKKNIANHVGVEVYFTPSNSLKLDHSAEVEKVGLHRE